MVKIPEKFLNEAKEKYEKNSAYRSLWAFKKAY